MFITKKYLHRRTFLRGAGAMIALPLLDAMIPAGTALANTAAKPLTRLGFVYFPHGAIMEKWTPTAEGSNFELSPILEPLKPFQKQLTVISGLGNRPGESQAVHAIVPATWLSCTHPKQGQDPNMAVTADQIAAKYIGQDTPLPSLEIATEAPGGGGACDRDYGCNYSGTIAFRTASTPLPMEYSPHKLFQRLFGRGDSPAERKELVQEQASILDMVSEDAAALQRTLGVRDRAMLSDYLETVRELERRVQKTQAQDLSHLKLPNVPVGTPDSFDQTMNLMYDMALLAYQANLTRIMNFMVAAEVSGRTYNNIGVPDAFHAVSHHANDPAKKDKLVKIQHYHTQVLAKFLTKMANTPDGDGSLLDHSIILYGSNMSNSDRHNQFPLPTAFIGGGCGKVKGGQHLRYPDHTPLANALLTMLDRAGVPVEALGDSTQKFAEV
ncbi:MAG: hypothetical protein JWM63_4622 [Gammaproteobacteria bacterium]|jgi:hypothetical protein|nr:hypothetical protein [Gammaproteobacteria bacterium]